MPGILYMVTTPIGNLGDISARALKTLKEVSFIAAEDTRVTLKLLNHFGIKKQLTAYHEHNRIESGEVICSRILAGEDCALVSDAGTPAISDPGSELVRLCSERGITTIAIPGPCAAIAALSVSGLAAGRFTFEGFLAINKRNRREHLNELKSEKRAMVFYEAPHKLMNTLNDLRGALGDRHVSISREMTKIYEETLRFTLSEAIEYFSRIPPRGEFVIVLEGMAASAETVVTAENCAHFVAEYMQKDGLSMKDAVKKAAAEHGVSKNDLYNYCINSM